MRRLDGLQPGVEVGLEEDFAFHLAVAKASHNDYFVSALLRDEIFQGMLLARTSAGVDPVHKIGAINTQHELIYNAILNGDADAARLAMRSHLLRCKKSTSHWISRASELSAPGASVRHHIERDSRRANPPRTGAAPRQQPAIRALQARDDLQRRRRRRARRRGQGEVDRL